MLVECPHSAPDEILDGTDKTLCMYDYAKEILEITNG